MVRTMRIADRSQRCIEMMETVLRSSRYFHAKFSQRDSHGRNLSTTTLALQKLGAVEPSLEVPIPIFFFFLAMYKSAE